MNLENKRQKDSCPKWLRLFREGKLGKENRSPDQGLERFRMGAGTEKN